MSQTQFDTIYKENYPKVIRLCMGYTHGNESQAQDLTQDVFIKVWENLGDFKNQSALSTWIYRITVNTCLMSLRKKKKLRLSNNLPMYVESNNGSHSESREQQFSQLYGCIDKLSENSKTIILLALEGLPQKEIAEIVGVKHEAIRVRLHRIKNELTKCVKK
ncbi:RNA polymerase sigma factor [Winogradskyella flava]|uniref:RNA polymerase sigma factor n=1 Tax=Winogradskyella flava TaxID=1884876 RepID=UPI00248F87AA|nr:sigma-70 family RNA polymerase sigma factor [Winogradskyella flava]